MPAPNPWGLLSLQVEVAAEGGVGFGALAAGGGEDELGELRFGGLLTPRMEQKLIARLGDWEE